MYVICTATLKKVALMTNALVFIENPVTGLTLWPNMYSKAETRNGRKE